MSKGDIQYIPIEDMYVLTYMSHFMGLVKGLQPCHFLYVIGLDGVLELEKGHLLLR